MKTRRLLRCSRFASRLLLLTLLSTAPAGAAVETNAPPAATPVVTNTPPAVVTAPATNPPPALIEATKAPATSATPATNATSAIALTPATNAVTAATTATTNAPAASVTATNAPPNGEIRFDFSEMPYQDVIQRFAQITGKPLIADVQLDGTLTFSDPRPYDYGEALDTLNLILAGKQAMLVETGRYLRLIPFDDLQKLPLPIYRGLKDTGKTRPGELVTVVLELKNLDAGEISESLKAMLTKAGSVAPLSRGRGLIITDRLENIRRVRELLTQIDADAPKQRQMKIYPLKNVSGTLMADLVNRTFGVATAPKRTMYNQSRKSWDVLPANPDDYVTAIYAAASNTLVLFGPAERMTMAEELITRFETESGARASEVKVYYPQMKADELARMIREAIPGIASSRTSGRSSRGAPSGPQAHVIADSTSNRLIVTAPATGQLEAIEKLIHQLDPTTQEVPPEEQARAQRELRIVQLQTVSANELVPLLRDAFAEQMRNEKGAEFTSRARILPDPTGGKVLLSGQPEELDRISDLIRQLDATEASKGEIRVFKLKVASARNVATMILGAMGGDVRGRYDYRRHGGLQRPGGLPVRAVGDDRSNTVFVMASPDQMKLIEELINGIEEEGATAGRQLRLVKLQKGSATAIVAMLAQLYYSRIRTGDPARRLAITAAPDDRTIAFEADRDTLDALVATVKELDVAPAEADHEIRTYAVPEGRVTEIVSTLSRLFGEQRDRNNRRKTGGFSPRFESDAASDTLIVAARSEDFTKIEALLEKLRTAVSQATRLRIFHLEHAQADQLVPVLRDMLGGGDSASRNWYSYLRHRGSGQPNEFKITTAPALNAVVIQATSQKLALATQLIRTLDLAEPSAAATVRTVVLQKANADAVAAAVTQMLQPRDHRGQAPLVRVTAVTAAKSILLNGPTEEVDRVVKLITELDQNSGAAGQETKVYQLTYADAKEVVQVLQSTLTGMGGGGMSYYYSYRYRYRGGSGGSEDPKITSAAGLNAVVVQANAEQQQQAAELIQQLDVPEAGGASIVQTVKLQKADADALVAAVNQVLTNPYTPYGRGETTAVRVSALSAAKSVLVRGVGKEVERVVALITELDQNSGEVGQETQVYQLKYAEAKEVVQVLQSTLTGGGTSRNYYYSYRYRGGGGGSQEARITEASGLNAVVVQANKEQQQRAAALIKQLDVPEAAGATVVQTVQLKQANANEVVSAITQILYPLYGRGEPPKVRVSALSAAKSILVQGAANEVERVVKLIAELDQNSGEVGQETKVYHLVHADAREVVQVLQSTLTSSGGSRSFYYFYRYGGGGGGEQTKITAAAALNAVVVQANAEQQTRAAALIKQLDVPEAGGAGQVRTVKLEKADADSVATAVSQALATGGRNGQPPAVRVTPVKIARSVLISGPTNEVAKVIELVHGLDETSGDASLEMHVYPLKHAEAREVVDVLESALGAGGGNQLPYWMRGRSGKSDQSDFKITAASGLNAVIVQATSAKQQQAATLIETLDVEQSGKAGLVRAIQLEKADPDSVAMAVNNALSPRDFRSGPATVRVTAVSGTRTVLVNGPPAEIEKVVELVRGLDETGGDASLETHVYQLEYALASKIAEVLQATLGQSRSSSRSYYDYRYRRGGSGGSTEFKVTAAEGLNALVVQATSFKQMAAADLIRQLDVPQAAGSAQVRTVFLQKADASAVAEAINQSLAPKDRRGEPPLVRVVAVMGTRSVLVNGPETEIERVVQLIQDLDQSSSSAGVETRIYQLKNGEARDLSRTLQQLLTGLARSQPRWKGRYGSSSTFTVAADERTNALIVSGPPDAFAVVEQVLPILDRLPERLDRLVQFFWLVSADAFDVQTTLEALFADRPKKDQPVIESDTFSNSLTVVANPADLLVIGDVVSQLDVGAEDTTQQVRLITLGSVPAPDMVAMLTNIFPQMSSTPIRILKRLPTPVFVPGTNGTTNARPAAPTKAAPATPAAAGSTLRIKPVRTNAAPAAPSASATAAIAVPAATSVAGATNAVAPPSPVFLSFDASANALIVSGPPMELDQIQDIIDSLTGTFDASETEIRQFKLKEADPVAVAKVLSALFKVPQPPQPQKGVPTPQTENGRPSPDRGREKPDKSAAAKGGNPQARKGGQPPKAPQLPRVAVVAEPRTRSVIIRASAADMPLLESVIQQLDAPGMSSQLEHRTVHLEYAQPAKLLPLVEQMIKQLKAVQPGDPVAVGADERQRALFVVGRSAVLDRLETMIHELDAPSDFAELELRVYPLKNATAAALADLLRGMLTPAAGPGRQMSDEAKALLDQVQRLKLTNELGAPVTLDLTKPVKIIADPPRATAGAGIAQRLIIGATPENLAALGGIVRLLDTVPIVEGLTARIIRLKYVDAAVVLDTLNSIFQQGGNGGKRPANGKSKNGKPRPPKPPANGGALANAPSIALDARNNALILSGLPESIKLAGDIITDLDRELDAVVTEVRLFKLEHAIASQLMAPLRAVFTEGGRGGGSRGLQAQVSRLRLVMGGAVARLSETATARAAVTIQADDASSTLIVAARSDLMPLIADVIKTLDVPPTGSLDTLRVFVLDHADAASVLRVLTDLARNRGRGRVRTEDLPTISMDERTNAIIASGSETALAFLEKLVTELDRDLPEDLQNVKLIPLENADAGAVAASLQRLMDERSGVRRGGGGRGGRGRGGASAGGFNPQRVVIIPDVRSNTLLVSGAPEGFSLVQSLAKQLDEAGPSLTGQVRLIPLEHATAQTLATMLASLFNQRYQAMRTPELRRNRPVILPDVRSNSLLVAAGVEDNQAIDDLLLKLDREPENPALELAIIGLKVNDAAQVAATLRSVFAARLQSLTVPGQPPMPTERVDVQADSLSNALIVNASPENLVLVRELVAKLDVEPVAAGGVIQTFTLKYADVQRVATMLRSLIDQGVYRPGVFQGPTGRGGRGGRGATSGGGGRDALAVTADTGSNSLIVSASPENLVVVKELIRQLDTPEFTQVSDIRTFTLKHARASHLATVLQQFFRAKRQGETTGGTTDRSIPVTVTADDRSNTLLVTGGKESFAAVERMIQQLDTGEAVAGTNFRVFALQRSTAAKLAGTLQRLFTGRPTRNGVAPDPVSVIPDTWANALIIGASDDDMAMIESLIEQLDSETAESGLQVQVFPLAKGDARRVATTLQSMFRGAAGGTAGATPTLTVNVDERLNAVIVSAGEADLKRVAELVKQLDTDQVARVAEIRVIPLENARAANLATLLNDVLNTNPRTLGDENPNRQSLLQFITGRKQGDEFVASALKEGVLIVPDTRINALVVSAPVDYVKLLEEIIHYLDQSAPQIAQIKVFLLQNADARQMALVLTSLFRLEQVGSADANERSVQYTLVKPSETGDGDESSVGAIVNSAQGHALTVTVDPRTNSLLVGGTDHYVALASEIIQTLDASPAQERQTEVYRLRNTRAQDVEVPLRTFLQQDLQQMTSILGPNAVGTAQNLLEREVGIVAETNSNTLLISASPRYFPQVKALIEELDQPQSQVLIQVLLAEVNLDQSTELGVEWNYAGAGDPAFSSGTDFDLQQTLQSFGGYYAALSGSDVQVLLRALRVDGRLEILSRPQILTADNKEAIINIGQRVPLITGSQVTPQGGSVNQFEYQDVGVILTVTPRISPDGFVRMDVAPTISSLSSSSVQVSPGLNVPVINQRTATTTVTVQSGQSVMIGGLIGSTEDSRIKKVPFLGDIPLLGNLFRSHKNIQNRTELLIVLTPQILSKGEGVGTTMDPVDYSDHEILNSDLLNQPERDPIQMRILHELHPRGTNLTGQAEEPRARPYHPKPPTSPVSAPVPAPVHP